MNFDFVPVADRHLPMLREWLLRPHVAEWWGPAESIEELRADYVDNADATRAYIAMLDGAPVGFIQCYVVKDAGGGSS